MLDLAGQTAESNWLIFFSEPLIEFPGDNKG